MPRITVGQPRHPLSQRFHDIIAELGELHDKKQADYGRAEDPFANFRNAEKWGVKNWVGAMVRLNDKVSRLQTAARGGQLKNEGVIDSLNDLAVYAIIARVLFEENPPTGGRIEMFDAAGSHSGYATIADIPLHTLD